MTSILKVFVMFPYCKNAESMLNFDGSVQDILKVPVSAENYFH